MGLHRLGELERTGAVGALWVAVKAPAIYARSLYYREIKRYLAEYDICSGERPPLERETGHSYSKVGVLSARTPCRGDR